METQARIPPALAAIHNFIRQHDPEEISDFSDILGQYTNTEESGELAAGPPTPEEQQIALEYQDDIAQRMFQDYLAYQ